LVVSDCSKVFDEFIELKNDKNVKVFLKKSENKKNVWNFGI